jgi:hypothetical protein
MIDQISCFDSTMEKPSFVAAERARQLRQQAHSSVLKGQWRPTAIAGMIMQRCRREFVLASRSGL